MQKLLEQYKELIIKWNKAVNLVGDARPAMLDFHFQDCLAALPFLEHKKRLLDLGAGAGLPGIPIKIALPQIHMILLDATRKRVSFISETIRSLGLNDVQAVWGRAEDSEIIDKLGKFDAIISRATWKLDEFLERAHPYCQKGTQIIAMKSNMPESEAKEADSVIHRLGITLWKKHEYELGGKKRVLLIYNA